MTDDHLLLNLEPSIHLTDEARSELQEARRKVLSGQADDAEVTRLRLLQRAYVDEQRSTEKRSDPLSVRLNKLWNERGDFSKFRASDLRSAGSTAKKDTQGKKEKEDDVDDLGVNLEGLIDGGDRRSSSPPKEGEEGDANDVENGSNQGDVMTIEEMRQLRIDMLQRLGMAQNSVYFSHALVSLLINSTKAIGGGDGSGAGRAGSAASVSAIAPAAARLGGVAATASASGFQRSMAGVAASVGSASSLEAELGIEPHVFGASKIEAQRRQFEKRAEEDEAEHIAKLAADGEEDADEENAAKEAALQARSDAQLLDNEVSDRAHDVVERFEGKLEGLRSAVDILRKGSSMLQRDDQASQHEKRRWQSLVRARQAGWGITPGMPARGTSAGKRELLQDLSGRTKDEPARDAWIGYGVPESHPSYRRRALAYVSHVAPPDSADPNDALLFAARPSKRMQIEVIVGDETWTAEGDDDKKASSMNDVLQSEQSQLFDAELFDTLVAESRALLASGIVPVTIEDEDAISLQISSTSKLRIYRSEDTSKVETTAAGNKHASPLVAALLCFLRLGLISRFRERAGLGNDKENESKDVYSNDIKQNVSSKTVIAPLLQPLLGILHYASFVAHLHHTLACVKRENEGREVQFELNGFQNVGEVSRWLRVLLQTSGRDAAMQGVQKLGGSATVSVAGTAIAHLTLAYPSQLSLDLRAAHNVGAAKGVRLPSLTIASLRDILRKEVDGLQ